MAEPIDYALLPASYSDLSVAEVQRHQQELRDLWKSSQPELDVDHGALMSLVLNPSATLLEAAHQAFATARKSSSFTALLNNPDNVSDAMLGELAKSYRITRLPGGYSSGRIRVFFREDISRTVGLSVLFTANGVNFTVREVVTLQNSTDPPSTLPNVQNLRPAQDGSGLYYGDLMVYAKSDGIVGNLVRGTELSLTASNIPYFVRAIALETFSGGENRESNHALVQRMVLGVSAKVLSSRVNMRASLLEHFPTIRDSSVIGAGDIEMTRDKHGLIPISNGGYADWYIGTTRQLSQVYYVTDHISQVGTTQEGQAICSVMIDSDMIPCLVHVTAVQDEDTADFYGIHSQEKYSGEGDIDTEKNSPRIYEPVEGMFTAYHKTHLLFIAEDVPERIRIYGINMPSIPEIQQWVLQCNQAPVGMDILVKGAIPTVVQFGATVHIPTGEDVDFTVLQNAAADHVNQVPFNGVLAVSEIIKVLHLHLPVGSYITGAVLFGTTYLPDGGTRITQTSDRLVVAEEPYVSNRTTMFYCAPADVALGQRLI